FPPFTIVFVNSWDVIIAGAGIIGVSLGLELRQRGAKVLVLDRGDPGQEAAPAASARFAAGDPETPVALQPLARESARMFPDYVRRLEAASQMQVDFRRLGTLAFMEEEASAPHDYQNLSTDDLQRLEPSLQNPGHSAFFVQE